MSKSKLFKSILVGAAVGAVVSMFDRKTREHTIETTKKFKNTVVYYAKNFDEVQHLIEQKVEATKEVYDKASDNIITIVGRLGEVKELPSNIKAIIKNDEEGRA